MIRSSVERRLRKVHAELGHAREELAVTDEQLAALWEDAHDRDGERHVEVLTRSRQTLLARIADLEQAQDDLLDRLPAR
jgi:hypothetical protein